MTRQRRSICRCGGRASLPLPWSWPSCFLLKGQVRRKYQEELTSSEAALLISLAASSSIDANVVGQHCFHQADVTLESGLLLQLHTEVLVSLCPGALPSLLHWCPPQLPTKRQSRCQAVVQLLLAHKLLLLLLPLLLTLKVFVATSSSRRITALRAVDSFSRCALQRTLPTLQLHQHACCCCFADKLCQAGT